MHILGRGWKKCPSDHLHRHACSDMSFEAYIGLVESRNESSGLQEVWQGRRGLQEA